MLELLMGSNNTTSWNTERTFYIDWKVCFYSLLRSYSRPTNMNTWKQNKRWAAAIFPPVWKLMFELLRFMSYLWTEWKCDETLFTYWGFVCIAFCNTWFSISNNHRTHWPLTANQIFPSPLLLLPIQSPQSGCSTPLFVAMWNFNFIYHNSIPALLHSFIVIVADCEG